jgi:hypothetical protein
MFFFGFSLCSQLRSEWPINEQGGVGKLQRALTRWERQAKFGENPPLSLFIKIFSMRRLSAKIHLDGQYLY